MKKKKKKKTISDKITVGLLIGNLALWSKQLIISAPYFYRLYQNPYRTTDITFENKSKSEKSVFVESYLEELSDTELLSTADQFDSDIASELLYPLFVQNPYIDLNYASEHISTTSIEYVDSLGENVGGMLGERKLLPFIKEPVILINKDYEKPTVFSHELIHSVFPSIFDCPFLEEGITSLLNQEFYQYDSSYPENVALVQMWIEVIGVYPFWEMRATGSIEPMKRSLRALGCDEEFITGVFDRMNEYHRYRKLQLTDLPSQRVLKRDFPKTLDENGNYDEFVHDMFVTDLRHQMLDDVSSALYKKEKNTVLGDPDFDPLVTNFIRQEKKEDTKLYFNTEKIPTPVLTLKK